MSFLCKLGYRGVANGADNVAARNLVTNGNLNRAVVCKVGVKSLYISAMSDFYRKAVHRVCEYFAYLTRRSGKNLGSLVCRYVNSRVYSPFAEGVGEYGYGCAVVSDYLAFMRYRILLTRLMPMMKLDIMDFVK